MANDNLSGVVMTAFLAKELLKKKEQTFIFWYFWDDADERLLQSIEKLGQSFKIGSPIHIISFLGLNKKIAVKNQPGIYSISFNILSELSLNTYVENLKNILLTWNEK